ncbi:IclR family transcriptional regulator [Viridibacillus arvi]|uniref:IclR family transcriptional regulator n=1 Tax=Viridibacillus arvi TaxID=263475 RepID=UPI00187B2795|nr:IclR family transcriptional regulator [Viridibacillus sp. JNUCC-6]QOV11351.1 IclR family transcriptional regulator [Viridibacillus sp. JNUCC-6]
MQTIDRIMQVISIVSNVKEDGITITELTQQTKLPLATLHRMLSSLIEHRLIVQDNETKKYQLGNVWLEFGLQLYDRFDYVATIRPELDRLANIVNESVYLSKPIGTEAMVIERIDAPNNRIRIVDQLGMRIPMHIGAANKSMLACMSKSQIHDCVKKTLTPKEMEGLFEKLLVIQANGYAISYEEKTEGTASIAAPIRQRNGEVLGAVSIGVLQFTLTEERIEFLKQELLQTTTRISQQLGFL